MIKWIVISVALLSQISILAQGSPFHGLKGAIIHYRVKGSGSGGGKATLYLDDFGAKKALHTLINSDSNRTQSEYYELLIDEQHSAYDMIKHQLIDNTIDLDVPTSIILTNFNYQMLVGLGFYACGDRIVNEKICSAFCNNTDTICLWKGAVMKLSMHLSMASIELEAIQIESVQPPASVFRLPLKSSN